MDHDGDGYIEVDILKDFHKDEWVNIVRLRNWEIWHGNIYPVVWLGICQVQFFVANLEDEPVFVTYNVKTGERSSIDSGVHVAKSAVSLVIHRNSLVLL